VSDKHLNRRGFLKHTLLGAGSLALLTACGGQTLPAASGAPTTAPAASSDDVQQAFDTFVKKEMPKVPIDLLRAAKQEGGLSCYLLVPEFNKVLVDQFQKTFRFVKVEVTNLTGGPLISKFMTEARAGQNIIDIVQPSSVSDAQQAVNEKLVLNYPVTVEPDVNMSHGIPSYVIPVTGEILITAYNAQKTSDADAALLSTWAGLLDPRWDGKKFGVAEVLAGGTSQLVNYYFSKQFGDKVWRRVASSGYSIYPGGNPALDAIITGENDLAIGIPGSLAVAKLATGAPLRWQNPTDWLVTPYAQFISAKAPHPNAAKLFQEFTMSPTGQGVFGQFGGISLRSGIAASGDFAKQPWYRAPDPAKIWPYEDSELAAAMPAISSQWRSIIK
jgi:ABC-type Fe3+ transport system substrate-binding protein